jgi:hypothetical protein
LFFSAGTLHNGENLETRGSIVRKLLTLLLIFVLAAAGAAEAVNYAVTTAVVGAGESRGVAVVGSVAVIGAGPAVTVFDITDPEDPVRLGTSRFGERAVPVGAIGDLALVFVFDVTGTRLAVIDPNPAGSPVSVGSLLLQESIRPDDLVVVDDTAWVVTSSRDRGLLGIDLADPTHPELATATELPTAAPRLTSVDDLLFLASEAGLMIVDVSDATAPEMTSSLELGQCLSIASTGGHTYLASRSSIHAIDTSDPLSPTLISTTGIERIAAPMSMALTDGNLIVGLVDYDPQIAEPDGGLLTFDLSDPGHPAAIEDTRFSEGPWAMESSHRVILAADADRGLRVFDPDPADGHDELARRNTTLDDAFSVAVLDDIAYLGDQGLRVFDISDHHAPELVSSVELDGEIIDLAVAETGDRIAALARGATLHVFDASDPVRPVLVWSAPSNGWRLAVSSAVMAVAAGNLGVSLFDISDPGDTQWLAHIPTNGGAISIDIEDGVLVVGMTVSGAMGSMAVYDVTTPTDPVLISQTPTSSGVYSVALEGARAAVATWDTVILYDLTDPRSPVESSRYVNGSWTTDSLAFNGDDIHFSTWPGGLQVVDFSHAVTPRRVIRTWWWPIPIADGGPLGGYDIAIHDGASVVADGHFGLRIVEVKRCIPHTGPNQGSPTVD